jgi:hypothetical protein
MLRFTIASLLGAVFACVPVPVVSPALEEAGAPLPASVTTTQKTVRIVPARDGGMTCLTADDVRRLQTYLDRCPKQDR